MKTFTVTAMAVLAFLVCGASQSFADEGNPGNIRVLKVKGDVTLTPQHTKAAEPLKEGAFIQQDQVIKTGKKSEALLLMSNGTTIKVEPGSSFSVEKFLQTAFDSNKLNYRGLKKEPSVSQTKLSVTEGSIVADVCKLAKGSKFDIATPVGVAGIRGTIVRVTVSRPGGGAPISVTVDLPQGTVDFTAVNGRTFTLGNGMTITFNLDGNTLTAGNITPMSPREIAEIRDLVEEALALIPGGQAFEGVEGGAPEQLGGDDAAGGFGGDQGTGNVGGAPTGGSGGGGGGGGGGAGPTPTPTPTPSPTPNPPVS